MTDVSALERYLNMWPKGEISKLADDAITELLSELSALKEES